MPQLNEQHQDHGPEDGKADRDREAGSRFGRQLDRIDRPKLRSRLAGGGSFFLGLLRPFQGIVDQAH
jgi:hypothetical protein